MKEPQILKYHQIDTKHFKMIKGSDIVITLNENNIEYFAWSDNSSYDEESGMWETKRWYNKYNVNKSAIVEISIAYLTKEEFYEVQVHFGSRVFGIQINDKSEANELYKKLTNWRNENP